MQDPELGANASQELLLSFQLVPVSKYAAWGQKHFYAKDLASVVARSQTRNHMICGRACYL